jgi:hypothetical protein
MIRRSAVPYDPYPHRRGEPRQLVLWWTGYLLIASIVSYGTGSTNFGYLGYEVTRPAATILIAMIGLGLGVLWPMVRLSQTPPQMPHPAGEPLSPDQQRMHAPTSPLASFFADFVVLTIPALVVMTAQCMPWMSGWPASVALTLALNLAAWSALSGALLTFYFSRASASVPRWAWMLVHLIATLGVPALALVLMAAGIEVVPRVDSPSSVTLQAMLTFSPVAGPFEIARDRSWLGTAAHAGGHHVLAAILPLALCPVVLLGAMRRA